MAIHNDPDFFSNSTLDNLNPAATAIASVQRKTMVRGDRLNDLPEPVLLHILSKLQDSKEVVRTSVLSTRWRFLWMSVPVSLEFCFPIPEKEMLDFMASINRELYYWRSCQKIRKFTVFHFMYEECYLKDVDLWVTFATKVANVEDFTLGFLPLRDEPKYEFPQFVYKNTTFRNLYLFDCQLNPRSSVNWCGLVSLKLGYMKLTEDVMEKVLSGCPNLECLELRAVWGIHHLEISSVKLRELIIEDYKNENRSLWLEILAPYLQNLQLLGICDEICIQQRNVPSLVTAILQLTFDFHDEGSSLEKELKYIKELFQCVTHVKNLELGDWCIECLSILELKGWRSPPSSWKYLKLGAALVQLDFPGVCNFLQSSSNLETLVIDWCWHSTRFLLSRYTNEDEQRRRFETHNHICSLIHLKTIKIKIINLHGPQRLTISLLPLVEFLYKNALVLEKFIIAAKFEGSEMSFDLLQLHKNSGMGLADNEASPNQERGVGPVELRRGRRLKQPNKHLKDFVWKSISQ